MKKAIPWITSLGLTLLVGFLIYFSVPNWGHAWKVMLQARPLFLLVGVSFTMLHLVLRAWRWGILLAPIKYPIPYGRLFSMTTAKYVINVIPPRAGEVVASVVLAKKERLSVASVIGTSFLERVLDVITVVIIFGGYLVLFSHRFTPNSERGHEIILTIQKFSLIGGLALSVGVVGLIYLIRRHDWTKKLPRYLKQLIVSFLEGFGALQQGRTAVKVVILSLAIWTVIIFQILFFVRAYLSSFPLPGAVLLTVISVVGIALPTPGGIGGFQFFMNLALVHFFSQYLSPVDPHSHAAGISNGCYIFSMIPVFLLGLFLLNREGLSWSRISKITLEKPPRDIA